MIQYVWVVGRTASLAVLLLGSLLAQSAELVGLNKQIEALNQQRRSAEAIHLAKLHLALAEKSLGPAHPGTATSLNRLAELHWSQGQYAEAEPLLRRALAISESSLGPAHPDTARSLGNLANVRWAQHEPADALAYLVRRAASEEASLVRNLSAGPEVQRLAFAGKFSDSTDVLLSFAFAQPSAEASRVALETVLRRKGRVLDSLADELSTLRARLGPTERIPLEQLVQTRAALAALALRGPGPDGVEAYRAERLRLEGRETDLVRGLSERSAEFRAQAEAVTLARVQAALPSGAVLVEYVRFRRFRHEAKGLDERWGEERYGTFLLAREGEPLWADLGPAAPIEAALTQWRRLLGRGGQAEAARPLARQLGSLLLDPLRQQLQLASSLLISPEAALHLLPWPALEDSQGVLLREWATVSLLDSGRDLLRLGQPGPTAPQPSLVLANPDYGCSPAPMPAAGEGVRASSRTSRAWTAGVRWTALPGTHQEAKAVQKALGLRDGQVLERAHASKAALLAVHGPALLHVATHGFFLGEERTPAGLGRGLVHQASSSFDSPLSAPAIENPLLRSGLVLAGANRPNAVAESIVTALELAQMDLRGTQLVTLSACDTGLGETANGEGVFGLRRALTLAGAQAQLISLWEVDDEATATLMRLFYGHLKNGRGRAEALREAQRELARTHPDPYFWAAFVLAGNPGPMTTRTAR